MQACPTCGRKLRLVKSVGAAVDQTQMSDKELFAHYRKTAHVEDVRFMLAHALMSPGLRSNVVDLLTRAEAGLSRTDTLREHAANLSRWRIERALADAKASRQRQRSAQKKAA